MIKKFGNANSKDKVILLHGGPGMDSSYFLPYLRPLGVKFELITYDQLQSSVLTISMLVDELKSICNSLEGSRIHLVGHSFGGILALEFSNLYSEALSSITLIACPYDYKWAYFFNDRFSDYKNEELNKINTGLLCSDQKYMKRSLIYAPLYFTARSIEEGIKVLSNINYNHDSLESLHENYMKKFNLKSVLKYSKTPMSIIAGAEDSILELEYQKKGSMQNSLIDFMVVEEAGHFPFVEKPREIISIICKTIQRGELP